MAASGATVGLIGTLPPIEAYDDPEVLEALGDAPFVGRGLPVQLSFRQTGY